MMKAEEIQNDKKSKSRDKMPISSKEVRETKYWLRQIQQSKLVEITVKPLLLKMEELNRILASIVKTAQNTDT